MTLDKILLGCGIFSARQQLECDTEWFTVEDYIKRAESVAWKDGRKGLAEVVNSGFEHVSEELVEWLAETQAG